MYGSRGLFQNQLITLPQPNEPDTGFGGGLTDPGIVKKPPAPPQERTYTWEVFKNGSVVASGSSNSFSTASNDADKYTLDKEGPFRLVVKDDAGVVLLDATRPGKTTPGPGPGPDPGTKTYGYTLTSDDQSYVSGGGLSYGSASEATAAGIADAKSHSLAGYTIKIRSWVEGTVGETTESSTHYGEAVGTKHTHWSYEITDNKGYAVNKDGYMTKAEAQAGGEADALAHSLVKYTIRTYSWTDGDADVVEGDITSYDNGVVTPQPPTPPKPPTPPDLPGPDIDLQIPQEAIVAMIIVIVVVAMIAVVMSLGASQ